MNSQNEQKQLKTLLFLLAGSKFLASFVIFYYYINSKNINYLPISFLLSVAGIGLIILYYKKVKINE